MTTGCAVLPASYCLLIPHYNQAEQLLAFLPALQATGLTCIVIDDGSEESQYHAIHTWSQAHSSVRIFKHGYNRGKGAAVKTGFVHARHLGFSHAIQIDADGQHAVDDIQRFIEYSRKEPKTLVCGNPRFDHSVPRARLYGRKVTDFWIALETWSLQLKDGLCGYRVYPLDVVEQVIDRYAIGSRMNFDTDILVKTVWQGAQTVFIDTKVVYQAQGISHFHYLRDNLLLIQLHTRLMLGMILRSPVLFRRAVRRQLQTRPAE